MAELSKEVATGCGLMKGEADPPLKPDSEYPAWLFELLEPRATTRELAKAYNENGLTLTEVRRSRCAAGIRPCRACHAAEPGPMNKCAWRTRCTCGICLCKSLGHRIGAACQSPCKPKALLRRGPHGLRMHALQSGHGRLLPRPHPLLRPIITMHSTHLDCVAAWLQLRRLWRLQNKARIREQNMMRSK